MQGDPELGKEFQEIHVHLVKYDAAQRKVDCLHYTQHTHPA